MAKESQKPASLDGLMLARVLVAMTIMGVGLNPNDLVAADEAIIKSFGESLDAHPDAVAYCQEQGIEPVVITEKSVEPDAHAEEPDAHAEEPDASPVNT